MRFLRRFDSRLEPQHRKVRRAEFFREEMAEHVAWETEENLTDSQKAS